MNFDYSDEQKQLQDTLARYIGKEYSLDKKRKITSSKEGYSRADWLNFADMGLLAFTFPEAYGGLDGSAIDTLIVMEAFGHGLVQEPYLSTVVMCGGLLRDHGSEQQKTALLPAIAQGELLLAWAHTEPKSRYALNWVATTAQAEGDGYILNGMKSAVLHGAQADKLLISARTQGNVGDAVGISLFLVDKTTAGLAVQDFLTQDGQRTATVTLSGVRVAKDALIGAAGQALPLIEYATDLGIAALCAEAVGIMDSLNAATLAYLKTRKQFGVAIGTFQVLQHRMADMFMASEQARSMAILAAARVQSLDVAERRKALSAAKVMIGQSGRLVGQQAVQLHGGMGVTEELDVSHYFKRLTTINLAFGDSDHHLAQISDALLTE